MLMQCLHKLDARGRGGADGERERSREIKISYVNMETQQCLRKQYNHRSKVTVSMETTKSVRNTKTKEAVIFKT